MFTEPAPCSPQAHFINGKPERTMGLAGDTAGCSKQASVVPAGHLLVSRQRTDSVSSSRMDSISTDFIFGHPAPRELHLWTRHLSELKAANEPTWIRFWAWMVKGPWVPPLPSSLYPTPTSASAIHTGPFPASPRLWGSWPTRGIGQEQGEKHKKMRTYSDFFNVSFLLAGQPALKEIPWVFPKCSMKATE